MRRLPISLHVVDRGVAAINYMLTIVGAMGIAVLGILIVVDVAGRTFFDSPLVGTIEMVRASIVAVAFLTIPYAIRSDMHVRTTVVLDRIPPAISRYLTATSYLVGAALFIFVAYAALEPMLRAIENGEYVGDGARRIPTGLTWAIVVITSLLSAIECLFKIGKKREPHVVSGANIE